MSPPSALDEDADVESAELDDSDDVEEAAGVEDAGEDDGAGEIDGAGEVDGAGELVGSDEVVALETPVGVVYITWSIPVVPTHWTREIPVGSANPILVQ